MRYLIAIVAAYLLLGTAYIFQIPDWQSPDEPAHYNYVRQLADGDGSFFPLMAWGDYDAEYQRTVVNSCFDPQYDVSGRGFEYEDYQPPLYYVAAIPLYKLSNGNLEIVRFTSLLMGMGTVILAWGIARYLFSKSDWLPPVIAGFVAFLPQHLSIMASVNNDALAELLIAAMLYILIVKPKVHTFLEGRTFYALGLLLGLAFLTKVTAYLMAGVIGIALLHAHWGDWERLIKNGLRVFVPAALIGATWWLRNIITYDGFDFLATNIHNQVVTGQLTTEQFIESNGMVNYLSHIRKITFSSFWGQFGWMAQRFDGWMFGRLRYVWDATHPLRLLTIAAVVGALWRLARGGWAKQPTLILTTLLLLNVALYLAYNVQFVQHQGRYLFPSLIPIGVAGAVGLGAVFGERIGRWLIPAGLFTFLLILNIVALTVLLPLLHHTNC